MTTTVNSQIGHGYGVNFKATFFLWNFMKLKYSVRNIFGETDVHGHYVM